MQSLNIQMEFTGLCVQLPRQKNGICYGLVQSGNQPLYESMFTRLIICNEAKQLLRIFRALQFQGNMN